MSQRALLGAVILFVSATATRQAVADSERNVVLSCTEIREEPGAPTFAFRLIKQGRTYVARYLSLPGDPSQPPEVVASLPGLECDFLSRDRFLFRCQKPGATVESVAIKETTLSPIADRRLVRRFREFRATGNEVPNIFLVFRFGQAATCR